MSRLLSTNSIHKIFHNMEKILRRSIPRTIISVSAPEPYLSGIYAACAPSTQICFILLTANIGANNKTTIKHVIKRYFVVASDLCVNGANLRVISLMRRFALPYSRHSSTKLLFRNLSRMKTCPRCFLQNPTIPYYSLTTYRNTGI